jgi:phenylpropionate dioxygenase-like ring-hydroxylating dioxygenase large terminal subunit
MSTPTTLNYCEEPILRRFWYPVAMSAAVTDAPLARTLLGTALVVWRPAAGEAASAALDRCPHRDSALSIGWLDGGNLVCPYHGWQFAPCGKAAHIPQLAEGLPVPPRAQLDTVQCTERYGWVWACLTDDPIVAIPEIPEYEDENWRRVPEFDWLYDCSAAHIVENNVDPAHIAFVHRESFGTPANARVESPEVSRTSFGIELRSTNKVQARPGEETPTVRSTLTQVWAPFMQVIKITYPDGVGHIMLKASTPIDNGTTRLLQTVLRTDSEAERPAADIITFDEKVQDEDRFVLDRIVDPYPLDIRKNVHLACDKGSIELRRMYGELLAGTWTPSIAGLG